MNRYSRDEVLHTALDMADLPTLDIKDRPQGILLPHALCIKWLQNGLDTFHSRFPFASDVTNVELLLTPGSDELTLGDPTRGEDVSHSRASPYLPADFSLDVKDGLIVDLNGVRGRLRRRHFQEWLTIASQYVHTNQPYPLAYIVLDGRVRIAPRSDIARSLLLWYYKLPPVLGAQDIPQFPDDWTLIEYVRLRALEWNRLLPPGTAMEYIDKQVADLKQAGLLGDTEYEKLPLGNYAYTDPTLGDYPYGWMGPWAF